MLAHTNDSTFKLNRIKIKGQPIAHRSTFEPSEGIFRQKQGSMCTHTLEIMVKFSSKLVIFYPKMVTRQV